MHSGAMNKMPPPIKRRAGFDDISSPHSLLLKFVIGVVMVGIGWSPSAAWARTVFADVPHPQVQGKAVTSDIKTLVENKFIPAEVGEKAITLADDLMSTLADLFVSASENGLTFKKLTAESVSSTLDEIDIMFDLIPKLQGFNPLAQKANEISSAQFYNNPKRRLIIWPLYPSKNLAISSEILKELNRGYVVTGILAHEVFSIQGIDDRDYSMSSELLIRGAFSGSGQSFHENDGPHRLIKPMLVAGGASVVGGGGSDLGFAVKILLRTISHRLNENGKLALEDERLQRLAETVSRKFGSLSVAEKKSFVEALESSFIQETLPPARMEGASASIVQIFRTSAGVYDVHLCALKEIEAALKSDSKFLDLLSLQIAESILADVVADRKALK